MERLEIKKKVLVKDGNASFYNFASWKSSLNQSRAIWFR